MIPPAPDVPDGHVDQGIEFPEELEYQIEYMMFRLVEVDPDAIMRIERIMHRVRIRRIVEKHCH